MEERQLSRIESKLDQLTEVVVELAKHDERITNLSRRQDRTEERLDDIEPNVNRNSLISDAVNYLAATLLGAVVTIGITVLT